MSLQINVNNSASGLRSLKVALCSYSWRLGMFSYPMRLTAIDLRGDPLAIFSNELKIFVVDITPGHPILKKIHPENVERLRRYRESLLLQRGGQNG